MPCIICENDLPILFNYPVVATSIERQASVRLCINCKALYEQSGLSWVGPKELTDDELLEFYHDLYKNYRMDSK